MGNYSLEASKPGYGYDKVTAPEIFRVSSTSLSLGTTYQWWLSRSVALQGSVLGGVGYAAAGNVTQVGERDYHFGAVEWHGDDYL